MEFLNHLSTGYASARPSLFEIVAQDKMRQLLRPSLQSIVNAITERYPRYWIHLSNRFDEAYMVLMLLVDGYYLRRHGGSFTETFYSIQRGSTLSRRQWLQSLFVLCVVPYLKARLDEQVGRVSMQHALRQRTSRWQQLLVRVYPYLTASYRMALLAYNVAYMFDYSPYPSPWFHWMRIQLQRAVPTPKAPVPQNAVFRVLDALQVLLPTALFFYSFMEWWYTSDYYKRLGSRPIPPAPLPSLAIKQGVCPVCDKPITNPACLYTGVVGCYPCIYRHVESTATCPVTHAPVAIKDIRKIYDEF